MKKKDGCVTCYANELKGTNLADPLFEHVKGVINISDDQIRDSLEGAQLKLQRERGTDVAIFSPRATTQASPLSAATISYGTILMSR